MKYFLLFASGFLACVLLEAGLSACAILTDRPGKIAYDGDGAVPATDGGGKTYMIDRKGTPLPYGNYAIKLKNGRVLSILKNVHGHAEIEEEHDLVTVWADENTIWVNFEKQ
jgi:hypothetical protein